MNLLNDVQPLLPAEAVTEDLQAAARRLDTHYIPSRYPDAFPTGVPADYYTQEVAQKACVDAEAILSFVQKSMP